MPKRMPRFTVDCSDDDDFFVFGRQYRETQVDRLFEERIADIKPHVLPGLRLLDEQGRLWKAELRVVLTPYPGGN